MPPRRHGRPLDLDTRARNMLEIMGAPGLAGQSRVGGAFGGRGGVSPSVLTNAGGESAAAAKGQLLVLSATADSIASGGDYVTFDTQVHRRGFERGGISADGTTVTWPLSASGSIQIEHAWDSYQGGGKYEIEVDGVIPDWGLVADASSGQGGCKRRGVDIQAGQEVKIKLTQSSGSAQTCDVLVEFQVQDPTETRTLLETVWLDSLTHYSDATAVSSTLVLQDGRQYELRVVGNVAQQDDYVMDTGSPDDVMFPSAGEGESAKGMIDADVLYAWSEASQGAQTVPEHSTSFNINTGSGFSHVEPDGGPYSTPDGDHAYRFGIVGEGASLSAYLHDGTVSDNNGQLRLEIHGRRD